MATNMKPIYAIGVVVLFVAVIGGAGYLLQPKADSESEVVARGGLHWHPTLEIYVQGEKMEIPANVGLGAVHLPMHTHEDLPIIHLEFSGLVNEQDLRLGNFFKNWGRDMRSFGPSMRMMVNGVENMQYETYIMRDGDKIELYYD